MTAPQAAQDFYLTFSDSSTGGLVSSKDKGSRRLFTNKLLPKSENHEIRSQEQPTGLISMTASFTA